MSAVPLDKSGRGVSARSRGRGGVRAGLRPKGVGTGGLACVAERAWAVVCWSVARSALLEGAGPALSLRWVLRGAAAEGTGGLVASFELEDPGAASGVLTTLVAGLPAVVTRERGYLHVEVRGQGGVELTLVLRERGGELGFELLYARTARLESLGVRGGLAEPPELVSG